MKGENKAASFFSPEFIERCLEIKKIRLSETLSEFPALFVLMKCDGFFTVRGGNRRKILIRRRRTRISRGYERVRLWVCEYKRVAPIRNWLVTDFIAFDFSDMWYSPVLAYPRQGTMPWCRICRIAMINDSLKINIAPGCDVSHDKGPILYLTCISI